MALPLSRNRTYAAGSPVVAADMNDLQDQIVALQGQIAALQTSLGSGTLVVNGCDCYVDGSVDVDSHGLAVLLDASARASWTVPVLVGRRLTAVRIQLIESAAGPTVCTATLYSKTGAAAVGTSTGFAATGPGDNTHAVLTLTPNLVLAAGTVYYLRAASTGGGTVAIRRVEFDFTP